MRSAGEQQLSSQDVPAIVSAILRALGLTADEADQIVRRISEPAHPSNTSCKMNSNQEDKDGNQSCAF